MDLVDVHAALHQSRGEGVAHVVETEILDSGPIASLAKLPHAETHLQRLARGVLNTGPRETPAADFFCGQEFIDAGVEGNGPSCAIHALHYDQGSP